MDTISATRIIEVMPRPRRKRRMFDWIFLSFLAASAIGLSSWGLWRYHGPAPAIEIFHGITYGCERLPDSAESSGLLHWIRADLNVPGVSLYTTPMDPDAQARGFEYKLQHTSTFVASNGLAVAVNGTLFNSASGMIRLPGDIAISNETVVSNHVVNHVDPNTFLIWCDDQNNINLQNSRPPNDETLAKAKWGIGGQQPILQPGAISQEFFADGRTALGIDPEKKLVWVVCFDSASHHVAGMTLARLGAKFGVMLDGGTSVAMVIGSAAKNVRSGTVTGNWRPVATHLGIRADPLP